MPITQAAKEHLAKLAEQDVKATPKAKKAPAKKKAAPKKEK